MIDLASHYPLLLAFWSPGPGEMLLLAVIALLLYGGDLPQVARSWGKTFAEFRRGLHGIQNDLNDAIYSEPDRIEYRPDIEASYVDPDYPESAHYPESVKQNVVTSEGETIEGETIEGDTARRD